MHDYGNLLSIMKKDPFVEEIHRVREKMLEDCGGDLENRWTGRKPVNPNTRIA
jgi:hypothetical protein